MTEERISELRALCTEYERIEALKCVVEDLCRQAAELEAENKILSTWLANAYIDPCLLPDIGKGMIEPPQPEDVIAYAKECIHGQS